MRKVKMIQENGVARPDLPDDYQFDEKIVQVAMNGEECVIYEEGDEIPEQLRRKLILMGDFPDDLVLWRYMPHERFESLLLESAIYFTPGWKLRAGEDYEMREPLSEVIASRKRYREMLATWINDASEIERRVSAWEQNEDAEYMCGNGISCWHMNQIENHAMWRIYVGDKNGVAIKTTIGRLNAALDMKKIPITAGNMTYSDYDKPHVHATRLFRKAHFYEFEKEFRLVYHYPGYVWERDYPEIRQTLLANNDPRRFAATRLRDFLERGPFVPVDLDALLSEVVVRGFKDEEYLGKVEALMKNYTSGNIEVRPSAVYQWPHANTPGFVYEPPKDTR